METENDLGFYENPSDKDSVIRARTNWQIRSWEIPRTESALHAFNEETGSLSFPGLYILFGKSGQIYVGEAKNLFKRLSQHLKTPEDKIADWDKAYILNDGRLASQSDFNDTVVRKTLELYLIKLFKANDCKVVAQGEEQQQTPFQQSITDQLKQELFFLLKKKGVVQKPLGQPGEEKIFSDELKKLFEKNSITFTKWGEKDIESDEGHVFVRPGSLKPKGWQITLRGRKPGSLIDSLKNGQGYLLFARDGAPLIPLNKIRDLIDSDEALNQDTVDVFLKTTEKNTILTYKQKTLDVTGFRLK